MDKLKTVWSQIIETMKEKFSGKLVIEIDLSQGGIVEIFFTKRNKVV